jgi:hypothetical protein
MLKGQLVQISYKGENEELATWWEYGVVKEDYDEVLYIKTKTRNIMYTIDPEKRGKFKSIIVDVIFLTKDDEPVMAKKSLFGRYKLGL